MRPRPSLRPADDDEELLADLLRWEGNVRYMYLDSKGLVTVGIGNLLRTVDDAKKLPFVNATNGGTPASEAEIAQAYAAVSQLPANKTRGTYKMTPSIELTDETSRDLALARTKNEFLPRLRRAFPDFHLYPKSAQRFMLDMAYNGGVGIFKKRNMVGLIEQRQWVAAIGCLLRTGNPSRTAWREMLLKQAAAEDAL